MITIPINGIVLTSTSTTYTITVNAVGVGPLVYSLNGGPFQTSNQFVNVPLGKHKISVKNSTTNFQTSRDIMLYTLATPSDNDSFTISYSFDRQGWVSFHDYIPNFLIKTYTKLWATTNLSMIFEMNTGGRGEYFGLLYPSKIEVPINGGKYLTDLSDREKSNSSLLSAVTWYSDVYDDAGNSVYDKTFDWITVKTPYQTTDKIKLSVEDEMELLTLDHRYVNIKNNENQWSFNELKDVAIKGKKFQRDIMQDFELIREKLNLAITPTDKNAIITPVALVRLEIENTSNYTIHLHEVKGIFEITAR
jgi:hypothetical protein